MLKIQSDKISMPRVDCYCDTKMSEPEKKKKRSRPKSEVIKSGDVEKRSHKSSSNKTEGDKTRSHSRRDRSKDVKPESNPETEELKRELEAAKAQRDQLNQQVAALQKETEELAQKYALILNYCCESD